MTTSNESGSLTTSDSKPMKRQIERILTGLISRVDGIGSTEPLSQVSVILDAAWKMLDLIDTATIRSSRGSVEKNWLIMGDGSIRVPSGFWSQASVFKQVFEEIGCNCKISDDGTVSTLNFVGSSFGSVLQAAQKLIEHAVEVTWKVRKHL